MIKRVSRAVPVLERSLYLVRSQLQLLYVQIQAEGLKEYDASWLKNVDTVARDSSGKFASRASNLSQFEISNWLEKAVPNFNNVPGRERAYKLLDEIKIDIDAIKKAATSERAKQIAAKVLEKGIPAATYIVTTVGPDIAIGLTLGESLPIILGGAAVFAVLAKITEAGLEASDIKNPWVKAAANITVALIAADLVKSIAAAASSAKFGAQGVYQITRAGKTADDLKATFEAVQKELETFAKPAKNLLEEQRRDRFLHSLALTSETAGKTNANFFKDLETYAGGIVERAGMVNNLDRYIEKELKGLNKTLEKAGVDVEGLAKRLAEMSDMSSIPFTLRSRRVEDVKGLVRRAKEAAEKFDKPDSDEIKQMLVEYEKLDDEFEDLLKKGVPQHEIIEQLDWMNKGISIIDKVHEFRAGSIWRANLINTETAMGKDLDVFVYGIGKGQKELGRRYESFLGSLVKSKKSKVKVSRATKDDVAIVNSFKQPGEEASFDTNWIDSDSRDFLVDSSTKVSELFGRMSPRQFDVKIDCLGWRAFSITPEELGHFINVGTGGANTLWHELGHILEDSVPQSGGFVQSSAFRAARTIEEGYKDLAELGMPGELVVRDKFLHPYTGKVYPGFSTEVVSTGLENLAVAESLHKLAVLDREHLMFALSYLRN